MPTKKQVTKQKQQQAAAKVPAALPIAYDDDDMSGTEKEQQNTS
jgi:hypothetical protein